MFSIHIGAINLNFNHLALWEVVHVYFLFYGKISNLRSFTKGTVFHKKLTPKVKDRDSRHTLRRHTFLWMWLILGNKRKIGVLSLVSQKVPTSVKRSISTVLWNKSRLVSSSDDPKVYKFSRYCGQKLRYFSSKHNLSTNYSIFAHFWTSGVSTDGRRNFIWMFGFFSQYFTKKLTP